MLPLRIVSSDELTGFDMSGKRLTDHESYLFQTRSLRVEFVIIEEEMAQLNDLFFVTENAVSRHIQKIHTKIEEIESLPEFSGLDNGLEDFELPKWNHAISFLLPSVSLLSSQMFFERSLKNLCKVYASPIPKPQSGQSKIDCYIVHLENKFSFNRPDTSYSYITTHQRLRNDLAHGDWDFIAEHVNQMNLPILLNSMKLVLHAVEEAIEASLNDT